MVRSRLVSSTAAATAAVVQVPSSSGGFNNLGPTAFVATQFGTADVRSLRHYIYPNGTLHTAFGTPRVQYKNIHAAGFVATRFGTAYAYNKTRHTYANSFVATQFGTAKVENHKIVFVGQVHTAFGTALVKNFKQYASVTAGVLTRFGTQWASTNPRRIYMWHPGGYHDGQWHVPTWPDEQIGTAALTHTHITPRGFIATRFGVAWAAQEIQYLHPWSFYDLLFGNQTAVTYKNQPRQIDGFVGTQFGAGSMSPLYLHPEGIAPTEWPYPGPSAPWWATKVTHDRVKNTTLGVTQLFGTHYVSYSPIFVYPPSFDVVTLWGVPPYGVMHKFDQWVSPEGLETEEWGRDDWDYRQGDVLEIVDYVPPVPVSDALFGSAVVGYGL